MRQAGDFTSEALDILADELVFELGQLGGSGHQFEDLPEDDKDIYREAITHILLFEDTVLQVQAGRSISQQR